MLPAHPPVVLILDATTRIVFHAAALSHPGGAHARKSVLNVDGRVGIAVGSGRVVDGKWRLAGGLGEQDFAYGTRRSGAASGLA